MHPNSITGPYRRSMVTSNRPFKPSVVPYLSLIRPRQHIPVQSSRRKLSLSADDIGPKSIFASLRNKRLRIRLHEPNDI